MSTKEQHADQMGAMVAKLLKGDRAGAITDAADMARERIEEHLTFARECVEKMADLIEDKPGNLCGIDPEAALKSIALFSAMGDMDLGHLVFAVLAEQAQETAKNKTKAEQADTGQQEWSTPPTS